MKKLIQILFISLLMVSGSVMAEPTIKDIYQMAQTDKEQALKMIDQVIEAHPKSAKAYFVKTEILLSMNRVPLARIAYNHADKLDSTFGYVKPETLIKVRKALGIKSQQVSEQKFDIASILMICGIVVAGIFVIWLIVRKRTSAEPQYVPQSTFNRPITPYSGSSMSTAPAQSGSGGGTGSGIMSGLATGVAVGAGAVAGAALANHLINGNHSNNNDYKPSSSDSSYTPSSDFGVSDSSSWDSSSSDSDSSDDSNW